MKRLSSLLLCLLGTVLLASFGCGSAKPAGGGSSQLSAAITTQPATSVQVNKTTTVTGTVTNDSTNAGVDWTLACGGSACGSITTHTASAAAATYTAPTSVPSAAVVITAKSAADATKTANANSITITGSGISIAITSQPASALQVNTHTTVTALVMADSTSAGVDWSLACSGACGTIDAHTASGVAANYTAPATVPAAVIVITAKATADVTKTANANSITISLTPPPISIAITSQPAVVLQVNGTTTAVATVTNDLLNSGVDWALACGGAGCGSITAHTASGATATYTAPAAVPSSAVTITANATGDNTKTANTTTVSISLTATCLGGDNSKNSELNGRYAFLFGGFDDATGNRIIAGGSFLADGSGNISSGVVDTNSIGTVNNNTLTGTYCVGADNRGTVVIVPQNGTPITYAVAVGSLSSNVATAGSFIEFDDNNGTTGSRGTGRLLKQDTAAFAAHIAVGTYVLGLYGRDTANNPVAVVGDFTVNAGGTITAGQYDVNNAGTPNNILTNTTLSGSLAAEDTTTGRFTGTLTPATSAGVGTGYAFYVVSATELIAVPTDLSTAKSAVSGEVFLQNAALTYSTSGTALTGTAIAYGTNNDTATSGASDASIGRVTFSSGTINGTFDQDNAGTSTLQHPDTIAYTLSSDGRATTGAGNPILYIFDLNKGFSIDTKNSIGVGHLEPQSSTSFSNGSFGSYFVGIQDFITSNKTVESGVVTVSSGSTANISQDQSSNQTPFLTLDQMQSLPFTVDGNGHVTFTGSGAGAFAYVISSTKFVVLDTSGSNPIINIVQQ